VKVESCNGEEDIAMSRYDPAEADNAGSAKDSSSSTSTLRRRNVEKTTKDSSSSERSQVPLETKHVDVRNRLLAIPSAEIREAIRYFRLAVDQAIEMANAESKVRIVLDRAV